MKAVKFFTDITTEVSNLCLLNVNKYNNLKKLQKDLIFIDPGVYELKKSVEYSKIQLLHELVQNLKQNEYISIDYPCDMNLEYEELFIAKSIENNIRYANNLHYICTLQYKFRDFNSFMHEFERLRYICEIPEKIIGLGNLCRLNRISDNPKSKEAYLNKQYLDQLFYYIEKFFPVKWLHFYGLSSQVIEYYIPNLLKKGFDISIDSTKWTRARRDWFKLQNGAACRKHNRNKYFFHYMSELAIDNIIF